MISYFICVHDLELINTFNHSLKNLQYLIVGNHYLKNNSDTNKVICNTLKHNIEDQKYLCSFTAWYAVGMNKLYSTNIVSLLEYDTEIGDTFDDYNQNICSKQKNAKYILSYSKTITNHYVFYKSTPWLEISLKKIYGIDLMDFVLLYKDSYPFWPTTTNVTMPSEILLSFIDWFSPMTKVFLHEPLGAYVHERAFFIFCVLNNINIIYAPDNILLHKQAGSHRIDDIYGDVLKKHNTKCLTHDLIPDYDITYGQEYNRCMNDI